MSVKASYQKLLQQHIDAGFLRFPEFVPSILEIPIEKVLPQQALRTFLGEDKPVLIYQSPVDEDEFRTLSAPHMISIFLSLLELSSKDKVLMLGAKGGVLEAILAKIAEFVFVLEQNSNVADVTVASLRKLGVRNVKVSVAN